MKTTLTFLTVTLMVLISPIKAQNSEVTNEMISDTVLVIQNDLLPRNFIKFNVSAIALKNYSFQYERVLSKKVSLAISYRTMPSTTLPFQSTILDYVKDNAETKEIVETMELSNYAITPEIRFYLSKKGYGQGFYIAPFYRFSNYESDNVKITYTYTGTIQGVPITASRPLILSGNLKAHTGGVMLGAQWLLGKHFTLDWWIVGAHFGSAKGSFEGTDELLLIPVLQTLAQEAIKDKLEKIDIPFVEKTVTIIDDKVLLDLSGPWAGLRAGLSLGFRF